MKPCMEANASASSHLFDKESPIVKTKLVPGALVLMGLLALTVSPAAAQPFKDTGTYKISNVVDARARSAIARTGADIFEVGHDYVLVEATAAEARALRRLGLKLARVRDARRNSSRSSRRPTRPITTTPKWWPSSSRRRRPPGDLLAVQHRHLLRGAHDLGRQDLRQRRHRRGRARGAVHAPSARPRAPDRRDGALHCCTC